MRKIGFIRVFVIAMLACVCAMPAFAQVRTADTDDSVYVLFKQGNSDLDLTFGNNGQRLEDFLNSVNRYKNDSVFLVSQRIHISSWASLEGSYSLNKRLAQNRAVALRKYVSERIALPDSVIVTEKRFFDWKMLADQVASSDMLSKDKVLHIIATVPEIERREDGTVVYERIRQLRVLDGGAAWDYMYRHHFPAMRYAKIEIVSKIELEQEAPVVVAKPAVVEQPEPTPAPKAEVVAPEAVAPAPEVVPEPEPAPDTSWHRHLDVKTNAIGLAMSILNAAVEVDLAPHFSLTLPIFYTGVNYFTETVKFRTFSIQPEFRYWIFKQQHGNDRLFIGAHFGMSYYNIATNGLYRYQDHNGNTPALGGGLSVGYRLPLGKAKRWKMEFTVGAGAYAVHYDMFYNEHNGKLAQSVKRTYIGLDNAAISVGYSFDVSKKKAKR